MITHVLLHAIVHTSPYTSMLNDGEEVEQQQVPFLDPYSTYDYDPLNTWHDPVKLKGAYTLRPWNARPPCNP